MSKDLFESSMLRSYDEKIFYNLFQQEDITDLKNIIKFAEGLVIKNDEMASMYENESTSYAANMYRTAIESEELQSGKMTEMERASVIKGYKEGNPYYILLKTDYGISPLDARRTKDLHILKSVNNTLDTYDTAVFYNCYYDMLEYFSKVTVTNAFDNQTFIREYYINYIIFGTILRFINQRMEGYFDVEHYGLKELKNGFISWGMDYFDEVPLSYQRRIYKGLNNLIRNKGTFNALDAINNLFSFHNVNINKYILTKVQDNIDPYGDEKLALYKIPFDENLDTDEHEQIDLQEITDHDPYWRSTEEEILSENFNTMATKYISADVDMDLTSTSKELSYFMSLLNEAEMEERRLIKPYIDQGGYTKKEAKEKHGILDTDFYFQNQDISPSPIYIYDALVALQLLIFKQIDLSDRIHRINFIKNVYGYKFDQDFIEDLREIRDYLYWNKDDFSSSKWTEYMEFFSSFRLKTITRYEQVDLEQIKRIFRSNIRYRNQLLYVSDLVEDANGSSTMKNYVKDNAIYDAMELFINVLMDPKRNVPLDILFQYVDLHELLSKFVNYQLDVGMFEKERTISGFRDNEGIRKDLEVLAGRIDDPAMNLSIHAFLNNKDVDLEQTERFIDNLMNYVYENPELQKEHLVFTKNLYVYLTIFTHTPDSNMDSNKINMQNFIDIYKYNEGIRNDLETYMAEENDPMLYEKMDKLWNNSFISDYDMSNYKYNNTLTSYLMEHDPNLYEYTQVHTPIYDFQADKTPLYREKVFQLVESLDTFMNLEKEMLARNNFVGMSQYVRRYMRILLEIFKSYSLQVLDSDISYIFDDPVDNGINIRDAITMSDIELYFTDDIGVIDSMNLSGKLEPEVEKDNQLNITDEIKMTINEE